MSKTEDKEASEKGEERFWLGSNCLSLLVFAFEAFYFKLVAHLYY